MSSRIRNCPDCLTSMEFRLGQFDCPKCGHTEAAIQPKPEQKASGPGFREADSQNSLSEIPTTKTQPTGSIFQPDTNYSSQGVVREDGLEKEKTVYFWLIAISEALPVLLLIFASLFSGDGSTVFATLVYILFAGFRLFLIHWIIMGDTVWIKWVAVVANALIVLVSLFVVVVWDSWVPSNMYSNPLTSLESSISGFFARIYLAIYIGWISWFISILFRDIGKLSGFVFPGLNSGSISIEKKMYFVTHILLAAFGLFVVVSLADDMPGFFDGSQTVAVFTYLCMSLVQLGIIWLVLFDSGIWSKWCCGGWAALGVLGGLAAALGIISISESSSGSIEAIHGALMLALNAWLVTILWRDIKELNQY